MNLEPLPPSVYTHHGAYYFRTTIDGKLRPIRLGRDRSDALKKHRAIVEKHKSHNYVQKSLYRQAGQLLHGIPLDILRQIHRAAEKRAKRRGLEFSITYEHVLAMMQQSKGLCELTGIQFQVTRAGMSKRLWLPSIDRIDSKLGYVSNNIRLVCVAVNIALQDFGDDALIRIASGIMKMVKIKKKNLKKQGRNFADNTT